MRKKTKQEKEQQTIPIVYLNISDVIPSEDNPRKYFDKDALEELAESIKQDGVLQPITVREKKGKYVIVFGERRYRASLLAETKTIPAIIREFSEEQAFNIAFTENIQREDVTEIDEAEAFKIYLDRYNSDFKSLAVKIGKSEVFVRNRYALANLIDEIKELINSKALQVGIGVLLASYDKDVQTIIYNSHLKEDLPYYNSWREYKYNQFLRSLQQNYNTNLDNALFDKTNCRLCPFNTGLSDLFNTEGTANAQCLDKKCFIEKTREHKLNTVLSLIEENPTFPIITCRYTDSWIAEELDNKGYEFVVMSAYEYPLKPEEPKEEDFIYEESEGVDMESYEEEKAEYQEDLEVYNSRLNEINEGKEEKKYADCIFIEHSEAVIAYYEIADLEEAKAEQEETDTETEAEETEEDSPKIDTKQEEAAIKELKEKDKRNQQLKVENSIKDIKDTVLTDDIDLYDRKATGLEKGLLYYLLIDSLTDKNKKRYFKDTYPTAAEKLEAVKNLKAKDEQLIIRDYIISELKDSSRYSDHDSKLLIELAKQYFPKETEAITDKYEKVYKKRQAAIIENIAGIQEVIDDKLKGDA